MASVGRHVHLFFRMKPHSQEAVKVFTNLRLPGISNPHQIHICYLRKSAPFDAGVQILVTEKLKAAWVRLFANDNVEVDWEVDWQQAQEMWAHVGEPKHPAVDRTRALRQILEWCGENKRFGLLYREALDRLAHQTAEIDDAAINWWLFQELPRLFYSF